MRPRYVASLEERVFVEDTTRDMRPDVLIKRQQPLNPAGGVAVLEGDAPELVCVPDDEIHESYVAIKHRATGQRVVAVIELVSPTNRFAGPGRDSYRAKQQEVRASEAHLVEIDLLRTGPHVVAVAEWAVRAYGPYD